MTSESWNETLRDRMDPALMREIDVFEKQIELRKQGKFEEKLFAETRLRRGVYGQRYDNGQRSDGERMHAISFPSGGLTKGPETMWDAPGMLRIKIPFGGLSADQLDAVAETAEEYSDGILHVTTRQDFQLHFVHIEDAPDIMRRLAAVGITTREACGNSVRNVTACPYAGVCPDEPFDVTPAANAVFRFLLGHPDVQDFGRKFKISVSGCKEHACAIASIHDIGIVGVAREEDGIRKLGFEVYVGGGLGSVPHHALLLDGFVPPDELLPVCQAVSRVFARLGEKKNRARARLKFLVRKLGIDEFRRLVEAERATMKPDERWAALMEAEGHVDGPRRPATSGLVRSGSRPEGYDAWAATNVRAQRQEGYFTVVVSLPLGDLTSEQARGLSTLAREVTGDTMRTTVEQNIVFRWVARQDLETVYERLSQLGLGEPGAGTIVDVTSCPGTDTCKLGISSSRGLAAELRTRLAASSVAREKAVGDLRIKVSGCFNACGQHHIADLGFLGVSRAVGTRRVPHFQVVLGGEMAHNGGAHGLAIGAVPSRRIPEVVEHVAGLFASRREGAESFQAFIKRIGKKEIRELLAAYVEVPAFEEDSTLYHDFGDPRIYNIGDMGTGECAGELVSIAKFGLSDAELELVEAHDLLDRDEPAAAAQAATRAMVLAAKALVRVQTSDVGDDPAEIVAEFRTRFVDTQLFWDKYAGGKFAQYLFRAQERDLSHATADEAHHTIEEAQLFIEAAYACEQKLNELAAAPTPTPA